MSISRRGFLKLIPTSLAGGLTASYLAGPRQEASPETTWPIGVPLGRVTVVRTRAFSRPHPESQPVEFKYFDDVVPIVRHIVGKGFYPHNHVWAETPQGFIYSSWLRPVVYQPNVPLTSVGADGFVAEVTLPYTDAHVRPTADAPISYRLYHSAIFQIKRRVAAEDGEVWYEIADENGHAIFARAESMRPIQPGEIEPISSGLDDKLIRVSLSLQSLSAYEGRAEVFRCRISSGAIYFGQDGTAQGGLTAAGSYPIWSKRVSRHMEGGTREIGYDLPGVGWVSYFASSGAAIHSTYWHNDFGAPKSHGCLNVSPKDAHWLFRWTDPVVDYNSGAITVQWPGGTRVVIEE